MINPKQPKQLLSSRGASRLIGLSHTSIISGVARGRFSVHARTDKGYPLFDPDQIQAEYAATKLQCELQSRQAFKPWRKSFKPSFKIPKFKKTI